MQRWTRPCERRQVASSLLLEVGAAHRIEFIGPNLTIVALNDARWYSTCSADEWSAEHTCCRTDRENPKRARRLLLGGWAVEGISCSELRDDRHKRDAEGVDVRLVWLNLEALPALSGRPSESFLAVPFDVGSEVAAARDFAGTGELRDEVVLFAVAGAARAFTHVVL